MKKRKPLFYHRRRELNEKHKTEKEDMSLVNQKRNEEKNRKLEREGAEEKKRKRRRIQLGLVKLHAGTMLFLIKVKLITNSYFNS